MTDVLGGALERREKLLVALKQLQPVRAQDLADWLGLPEATASAALKELARIGAATRAGDMWSARLPLPAAPTPVRPAPMVGSDEGPRRRIVRRPEPQPEAAPAAEPAPLPPRPEAVLAADAPSRTPQRSRPREVLETNRHLLGTESDPKLAAQLGVPREALTQFRLQAGIRSWREQGGMRNAEAAPLEERPRPEPRPAPKVVPQQHPAAGNERGEARRKLLAVRNRLGMVPDQFIAQEVGVSRAAVVKIRDELHIPAWQPKATSREIQRPTPQAAEVAAPAPAPAEPVAPPAARVEAAYIWAATTREGEEVRTVQIAAVSLVAAARAAVEAMDGRVDSISLVGSILLVR